MKARDNPLRSARIESLRYLLPEGEKAALLEEARHHPGVSALVGPHGTGKTVLLEDLRTLAESKGRRTAWTGFNHASTAGDIRESLRGLAGSQPDFLFIDGGEVLGLAGLHRLRSRFRGLAVITTLHRPRAGVRTLFRTRVDPEVFVNLTGRLLGRSAPPPEDLHALLRRHRGNMREAFLDLYLSLPSAMAVASR